MPASTDAQPAPRLRRPRWRDPRLLIGLLLVLASVAGVVALLQSADRTQAYWAAKQDLAPGAPLSEGHFVPVQANLAGAEGHYLSADEPAPVDRMLVATVRAGELVPADGVVDADPQRRRPVGLTLAEPLPAGVGVGDRVDVWVALPVQEGRGFRKPERLASGVELSELVTDAGAFGAGESIRIQAMVGPEELPELLEAKVREARITVVPTLGGH